MTARHIAYGCPKTFLPKTNLQINFSRVCTRQFWPKFLMTYKVFDDIKHSNLQLPTDSGGTTQWFILKGKSSETRPYDQSPKLQSSLYTFCVVMVVFDGFRSTLIWSQFKIFPGEACPQTHFGFNARAKCCAGCARCMAAPNSLIVCPPPPSSMSGSARDKVVVQGEMHGCLAKYLHWSINLFTCTKSKRTVLFNILVQCSYHFMDADIV